MCSILFDDHVAFILLACSRALMMVLIVWIFKISTVSEQNHINFMTFLLQNIFCLEKQMKLKLAPLGLCCGGELNLKVQIVFEPRHEISNNVVCATSKGSDQPAQTRSLIRAFASRLNNVQVLSSCPNIIWSL